MRHLKRDIFFLISFFFLMCAIFVLAFPVNALDQVYDNYTDLSRVEIVNDVVRNTTFNAMELDVFNGTGYNSDMDIWVTGGFIRIEQGIQHIKNINGTSIWFDNVDRDEGDRIFKDFGVNYFDGNWQYIFRVKISSIHTSNARCYFMGFSESTKDHQSAQLDDNADYVTLFTIWNSAISKWQIALRSYNGSVYQSQTLDEDDFDLNKWYHVLYIKNGDNMTTWFYKDALRTDLEFMLTVLNKDMNNLRYFHPLNSQDLATGGRAMDLTLNKVRNYTAISGYVNNGYFYTKEMISSIGGKTVVLLTNATIPTGDTLTVEFSEDNLTWGDHEGNPGGDSLIPGFESVDLRDLAYSDLYMRYNFSDGGADSTPRLYQIIVITNARVAGNASIVNVTGVWTEYNFTSIITLIGTNTSTGGNWLNQTYWMDLYQYNVTEVTGAPGYDIQFNITDLPEGLMCLELVNFLSYDGSTGHVFEVQAYNYTSASWIFVADIPDNSHPCFWLNGTIGCQAEHFIQNGLFQGRYYHPSPGNLNHDFVVDYGKLRAFAPFPGPAPVGKDRFIIGLVIGIALLIIAYVYYEHGR